MIHTCGTDSTLDCCNKKSMHVCISIVSHSQSNLVNVLLSSLDEHVFSEQHMISVIVTENTTAENSYSCKYPTKTLQNLRRKGFGSNHNAAFENSSPDIFLIVNPDIVFTERFDLDELVSAMTNGSVDVTSPVIVDDSQKIADYKRADLTISNLAKRKFFRKSDDRFDWYAGMFLIITGKAFRSLNGFDPLFFMYVEDCDLCMRATKNGYTVADTVGFSVRHDARRASRKFSIHLYWHCSSLIKYWYKGVLAKTKPS